MNLQHSSEQTLLRDSISAALDRGKCTGADWGPVLADQGVSKLLLPEAQGGFGLGMVEATVACVEAGRRCLDYPLADMMVMMGAAIKTRPETAPALLEGRGVVIAASSGTLVNRGGRVTGILGVAHLDMADWVVAPMEDDRVAVLAMSDLHATPGVEVDPSAVTGTLKVDLPEGSVVLNDMPMMAERLALLRCADLAGAAAYCFDIGIEYLKDRRQFGQPIGANQALKHMAADDYVTLENIHVAIDYAAAAIDRAFDAPSAAARAEAAAAVAVALCTVPESARRIAENAIQFHGGIGVTWEYPLNRYLRRILRIAQPLGSAATHRCALLGSVIAANAAPDWPQSQTRTA
ncbi:acyl-CoA dehydrogenase family protein [Hoeflea sp. EC-HK425]|uniref:acyl-CoA dehydrogenase family protein n=1 Tax=Hoeflea sp. EC-HK425 TaxID=2038388 RepID=UPI0012577C6C|nr:acyl-CoA dehydrogenase family protein [Hoeflea sp. EC-HK425]VVT00954.1 conserved hypothetical protein [Hoeflea sp. EC-HK425]